MKLFVIFILSLVTFQVQATGLKTKAMTGWEKVTEQSDTLIFRKHKNPKNEMVILQSFPAQKSDAALFDKMSAQTLTQIRRKVFDAVGLFQYQVSSLRNLSDLNEKIKSSQILIEASYQDYAGKIVYIIERQYVVGENFFVLSYRSGAAIHDYDQVRRLLDQFKPMIELPAAKEPSRAVAGEMSVSRPEPKSVSFQSRFTATPAAPANEEKMSAMEIGLRCQDVPPEKRRSPTDTDFTSQLKTLAGTPIDCAKGVLENIIGILKGFLDLLISGAKFAFDSEYRSEVTATIGTIAAEAYNYPQEFSARVLSAVYEATKKNVGDFFECLNPSAKIETTCKILSDLVGAGLLAKVIFKTPMAAEEAARFAKITEEAARGPYIESTLEFKGKKAYKILGNGDDTLSKVANRFEKDKMGVYVRTDLDESIEAAAGVNEAGKPSVFIRKSAFKDPEGDAGYIAHEATHTVNLKRAQAGQELGYARTVKFKAHGESRLNPGLEDYKFKMRIDEIHARAVQSGTELNRAEKALQVGNKKEALRLVESVEEKLKEAEKMIKASRAMFREARSELESPVGNSLNYDPEKGKLKIRIPFPTQSEIRKLEKIRDKKSPEYAKALSEVSANTVQVPMEKGLSSADALKRAEVILNRSEKSLGKFEKNSLAKNKKRLKEMKIYLGLPVEE